MQNLQKPTDIQESLDVETQSAEVAGHEKHAAGHKEPRTNEEFIQKVLEIEKQADKIHDKAVLEADLLPVKAEQESQAMLEKARLSAQEEASKLVDQAKVQEKSEDILTDAQNNIQHSETLASTNFNRAVAYVIARVIGRE